MSLVILIMSIVVVVIIISSSSIAIICCRYFKSRAKLERKFVFESIECHTGYIRTGATSGVAPFEFMHVDLHIGIKVFP